MRVGVVLQGVDAPREFEMLVEEIDHLGYDDLWLTDSSLHARNCYAYLALAAPHSSRLRFGTAVTNPLTRHPGITAQSAVTLHDITEGRFVLGIGAGDRPLQALGLEPAPLGVLRDSISAIRALVGGEVVTFDGQRFQLHDAHLRFTTPGRQIPIHLAASGPKTLELAGEISDGVILLSGLFATGVRWAIDRVQKGAAKVGRPRPPVTVFAYGAIDDEEPARALAAARSIAAWFPQTAPYYCELAGLDPAIVAEVRSRYRGGEFQEAMGAAKLLPDGFVRRMALAGTSQQARAHLDTLRDCGAEGVAVFPLGENRRSTIDAFAQVADSSAVPR